ncbi:MAG: hypothetical protein AAGA87_15690 [Pseudomonadota bacterium]
MHVVRGEICEAVAANAKWVWEALSTLPESATHEQLQIKVSEATGVMVQ